MRGTKSAALALVTAVSLSGPAAALAGTKTINGLGINLVLDNAQRGIQYSYTIAVTGGSGSITTRSYGPIDTSEPVPWEQYSQVWGDQIGGMISECYYSYATIVGSYTISGGSGSVTLGPAAPTNPAQSPPVTFSQPYAASVRLAVKRLHEALQALCGGSFPVS